MEGGNKMTRKEQIKKAGIEYTISTRPMCICGDAFSDIFDEMNRNLAFEEGAKWADEHPNSNGKELLYVAQKTSEMTEKEVINKACEWLKFRVCVNMPIETNENGEPLADSWIKAQMERVKAAEEFIAEFRQAMKGGAE